MSFAHAYLYARESAIEPRSIAVQADSERVVERKVPFPARWLKGLGEVQAFMSRMQPRFSIGPAEAIRFVRSLPAATRRAWPPRVADERARAFLEAITAGRKAARFKQALLALA